MDDLAPLGHVEVIHRFSEEVVQRRLQMRIDAFFKGAEVMLDAINFFKNEVEHEGSLTAIEAAMLILDKRMEWWDNSIKDITLLTAEEQREAT